MAILRRARLLGSPGFLLLALGAAVVACGDGTLEPRAREPVASRRSGVTPLEAAPWVGAGDGDATRPPSRVLSEEPHASIVVGERAPPPEPTRPRRTRPIDVSFRRADLENVARFLGDAGHFNVVVESGLTATVNVDLRKVDPFDALVAIARANGAAAIYEDGIVTVRMAAPHGRP